MERYVTGDIYEVQIGGTLIECGIKKYYKTTGLFKGDDTDYNWWSFVRVQDLESYQSFYTHVEIYYGDNIIIEVFDGMWKEFRETVEKVRKMEEARARYIKRIIEKTREDTINEAIEKIRKTA